MNDRINSAVRIWAGFAGERIGHPCAVNYEQVFVATWLERQLKLPAPGRSLVECSHIGAPIIERTRHEHGVREWIGVSKHNGDKGWYLGWFFHG